MKQFNILLLGQLDFNEIPTAPAKVAIRLFEGLHKSGYSTTFIEYFLDGNKYSLWKKIFGYEKIVNQSNDDIYRFGVYRFIIYLIKNKPDIIHIVNYDRFPLISFLLRPFLKYKILYQVHYLPQFERSIKNDKVKKIYLIKEKISNLIYFKFSDLLIFLSIESINIAAKYYNFDKKNYKVMSNGIDECFHKIFSLRSNKNDGNLLKLIFIGDLNRKEKGLDFLLNVFTKINDNIELYIIGDGFGNFSFNTPGNINIFLVDKMKINDLAEFYKNKDVFVSSSIHESFGMAAVEAMAAGLIPIVTNQTGMSRFINDGINGFSYNYGDVEKLINILQLVYENKLLRIKISNEASKIYNELSWANICESYYKLYMSIV